MTESAPIPGVSLGRRLAVGGMGELFVAERTRADGTREACVVKRLLPGAGPAERFLFEREARALVAAQADDGGGAESGVVRVLASHGDALVLEYIDGVDLATLLDARRKRGRSLPIAAGLAVVGLGRGLATLARLGIVHRDVHPGNLLLGRDGVVRLTDLGVAAFSAESGPTIAGLKGTLAYMAPEQLRDGTADLRSDLYAAGLVAYETLTGVLARPVGAVGLAELLRARERLPVRPSEPGPSSRRWTRRCSRRSSPTRRVAPSRSPAGSRASSRPPPAPGLTPDAAALASAVQAIAPSEVLVALTSRTLAPQLVAPPPPVVEQAAEAPRRRVRWAWVVGPLGLGAAGLGVWAAARPSAALMTEAVAARSLATLAAPLRPVLEVDAAADVDSSVDAAVDSDAVGDADAEAVVDAPVARPDALARDAVTAARDAAPEAVGAAVAGRHKVHLEGTVYVAGAGARGLAPGPSWLLADGDIAPLTVTGGSPPFAVRVRLAAKEGRLRVNVAATDGAVYDAACGKRAGPTPLVGLHVPLGGAIACRLTADNGASMEFVVVDGAE
ncbi:MAG: protein kinase [Myxococcota bacterium]